MEGESEVQHSFIQKTYPFLDKGKVLFYKHKRLISGGALLTGFIVDNLTLSRVDLLINNLILLFYLVIAGASILLFNLYESGKISGAFIKHAGALIPLVFQFSFGALFSGFFVFYSRSASFAGSWIFVLFLAAMLIGNEFFERRYERFVFQISIFFFALFSFSIFSVPLILREIGIEAFLLSGFISIFVITLFLGLSSRIIPERIRESKKYLIRSIAGIYIIFNFLYFTNIIPPIPLSLKDAGIFHNVERTEEHAYKVLYEEKPWHKFYKRYNDEFHRFSNEPVYFYSSVFAPGGLNTPILHEWQYFDEEKNTWVTTNKFEFSIVGGRDGGYRGYSLKRSVFPGKWRVDVITERGQILGRAYFTIFDISSPLSLKTDIK